LRLGVGLALGNGQNRFADMLATLRRQGVKRAVLSMHLHGSGSTNVLKTLLHMMKQVA